MKHSNDILCYLMAHFIHEITDLEKSLYNVRIHMTEA